MTIQTERVWSRRRGRFMHLAFPAALLTICGVPRGRPAGSSNLLCQRCGKYVS